MKYEFNCILSLDELKAADYIRPSVSIPCDSDFTVSVSNYNDFDSLHVRIYSNSKNFDFVLYARNVLMFDQHILFDLPSVQFNKLSEVLNGVI